jgi:hypothetical protein
MQMNKLMALTLLLTGMVGCLRMQTPDDDRWPCNGTADCVDGKECYSSYQNYSYKSFCAAKGYCEVQGDCVSGKGCLDNECVDVECSATEWAACGAFGCDLTTYTCNEHCRGDVDCASGNLCIDNVCIEPECRADSLGKCDAGYGCDVYKGKCLTACSDDTDCAGAYRCDRSARCVPRSATLQACSVSCGAGEICDGNLQCVKQTTVCDASSCADACCPLAQPDTFVCVEECSLFAGRHACQWNAQCASGFCVSGECTMEGLGQPGAVCTQGSECASSSCCVRNGPSEGMCSDETACNPPAAEFCESNSECVSEDCFGAFCYVPCGTNDDCFPILDGTSTFCVRPSDRIDTMCLHECLDDSDCVRPGGSLYGTCKLFLTSGGYRNLCDP